MSPNRIKQCALLLICGLLAATAHALKSDKSKPINIQADHADFRADPKDTSIGTGIYTGHVVITQGSIMLTADKAILHVVNNELDTADITGGPATFQQQPDTGGMIHGYALEITYEASKNQIDLITNARMTQAVNQLGGTTHAAPAAASVHAPGAVSTAPAPYVSQGERLMTADHIRYNTETQRMVATGGKDEGRVHITFPPKQLPGETPLSATMRKLDFDARAAAAASDAAPPQAAPSAATHTGAPP